MFLNYQWDTRILNSTQEDILGDCAAFCWECCYLTTIALGQVYYHLEDETTLCSCMTISDPAVYDLISSEPAHNATCNLRCDPTNSTACGSSNDTYAVNYYSVNTGGYCPPTPGI